ncbi:hypothetical protein TNCV_3137291 [Trichonephila clavipes]|nr:hypothetical protein TNCV_3137291 [Trichonephila clavipes]
MSLGPDDPAKRPEEDPMHVKSVVVQKSSYWRIWRGVRLLAQVSFSSLDRRLFYIRKSVRGQGHELVAGSWVRDVVPLKTRCVEGADACKSVKAQCPPVGLVW